MAQLNNNSFMDDRMLIKAAMMECNDSVEDFLKSDKYDAISLYLKQKLEKHLANDNVEKVVGYYVIAIRQPFDKMSNELKLVVRDVKQYLREKLLLG